MRSKRLAATLVLLASVSLGIRAEGQRESAFAQAEAGRTRCDPSLPIRIELIPSSEPHVGQTARFRVEVESDLDPDLVQDMRVQYELPDRVRMFDDSRSEPRTLAKSGRSRLELGVIVPDESRYSIRARLIVRLTNGKTISQTAIRWIDLGAEDPPEGMIGRNVDADGVGIRVYQGTTVRR
jgi:hypothetical protein